MDTLEVGALKLKLEANINQLLQDFEGQTGLKIHSADVWRSCRSEDEPVGVRIQVRV